MNRPPNGHGLPRNRLAQQLAAKPMTPEERVLWMAKQQLPPGYTLLHATEVEAISNGLAAEHGKVIVYEATIEDAKTHLDSYWTTQPDLSNAIQEAVFDANRYRIALTHAEAALEQADQTPRVIEALAFIKQQREARRAQ